MSKTYLVADLFCGAGGSSTGAERAFRAIGAKMILVCVNHWPLAIETHRKNHPTARHYIEDVSAADPERLVPEGYLDLLMASPECRFFSRARGGKPIHDQSRMNPWAVQRWLTALKVRTLLVENVPEFVDWGPLDENNRPDRAFKGLYFEAWIRSLWDLGYTVEWRYLNAANFGDATTRTRFFLQARKDGKPIHWPVPTHSKSGSRDMIGKLKKWRAAREIIDWEVVGRSLLDDKKYKKRPLSINTRRRIARGLERYGGVYAPLYINLLGLESKEGGSGNNQPFVMGKQGHIPAYRSSKQPLPTLTTSGKPVLIEPLVEPFILGQQSCSAPRNTDMPIPTVAGAGAISLVDPQMVVFHGQSENKPVDEPLPSLPTKSHIGLVKPQLVKYYGTKQDTSSVDEPLDTVTTKSRFGLVEPIADPFQFASRGDGTPRSIDQPIPTITNREVINVVEPTAAPFVVPNFGEREGQIPRVHSIEHPLPAVTGHGAGALVNPLLVQIDQSGSNGLCVRPLEQPIPTLVTKNNLALTEPVMVEVNHGGADGNGRTKSVEDPLPTITTKRNIGIVEPVLKTANGDDIDPRRLVLVNGVPHILDIRFRMLNNRELARAMGFDDQETDYEFVGTVAEVTKQIGNAVPVNMAAALVKAIFGKPGKSRLRH